MNSIYIPLYDYIQGVTRFNNLSFPLLIIDDNLGILEVYKSALGDEYRVITCSEASEFIAYYKKLEPAIAIVDQHLGDINGLDLVKNLNGLTKIIMISGDRSTNFLEKAVNESRIVEYISKPFVIDRLIASVGKYYNEFIKQKELEIENSKIKLQAAKYQKEISKLNDHLFDTMINSYSNYKSAEKLAMYFDDFLKGIVEDIIYFEDDKVTLALLYQLKRNFQGFETYFGTSNIHPLNWIIELLIHQIKGDVSIVHNKVKDFLSNHILHNDETVKNQINVLMRHININNDNTVTKFRPEEVLQEIVDLNLIFTSMINLAEINDLPRPSLQYLIVIKNELPIYRSSNLDINQQSLSLISNFITALSNFVEEILAHGEIKAIQLEQGVILIKEYKGLLYCSLVDYETAYFRNLIELFVSETGNYILKQPDNVSLDDDEFITSKIDTIFLN